MACEHFQRGRFIATLQLVLLDSIWRGDGGKLCGNPLFFLQNDVRKPQIWKPKCCSCWAHVRITITVYIFPEVWQKNVWMFFFGRNFRSFEFLLFHDWLSQWKVKSLVSGCVRVRWIIPILFCSAQLLMLLGQSSEVAQLAAAYNRTTAPALFCLFQYQASRSWVDGATCRKMLRLVVDAANLKLPKQTTLVCFVCRVNIERYT